MAIVSLDLAKKHLGITEDWDDILISAKLDSAQRHLETWLGYAIEDRFTVVPADLEEAVLSLCAHFFENREASVIGVSITSTPLSVRDIIAARRDYLVGGA